jgi:hypothetical protein
MTLERGDGYYLGPLCINYGFVVFGYVAAIFVVGRRWNYSFWSSVGARPKRGDHTTDNSLSPMLEPLANDLLLLPARRVTRQSTEDSDDLMFEEEQRR